jgi:hypothetical protein
MAYKPHSNSPPLAWAIRVVANLQFMRPILLTLLSMGFGFCSGQRLNTIYYGVSSDSLHRGHQIKFTNDTTLELSTFPRHMSHQFTLTFSYKKNNKILTIHNGNISQRDSIALLNNGFNQYVNQVILFIDGKALTDASNGMVYVPHEDFKKYNLIYIIDGKVYKQETGLPDSYGLINSTAKENKALTNKMTSMKADLSNYDIKIYKGLTAYKKFGYESVFGVIELKRKL